MGREGRDYWEAQLSEYWDSGLTIQDPHCRSHFSPLEITHNQRILFQSYVKIE